LQENFNDTMLITNKCISHDTNECLVGHRIISHHQIDQIKLITCNRVIISHTSHLLPTSHRGEIVDREKAVALGGAHAAQFSKSKREQSGWVVPNEPGVFTADRETAGAPNSSGVVMNSSSSKGSTVSDSNGNRNMQIAGFGAVSSGNSNGPNSNSNRNITSAGSTRSGGRNDVVNLTTPREIVKLNGQVVNKISGTGTGATTFVSSNTAATTKVGAGVITGSRGGGMNAMSGIGGMNNGGNHPPINSNPQSALNTAIKRPLLNYRLPQERDARNAPRTGGQGGAAQQLRTRKQNLSKLREIEAQMSGK
jgi:hypothetical protein